MGTRNRETVEAWLQIHDTEVEDGYMVGGSIVEMAMALAGAEEALRRIASGNVHYPPHHEASRSYMIGQARDALAAVPVKDTEEGAA